MHWLLLRKCKSRIYIKLFDCSLQKMRFPLNPISVLKYLFHDNMVRNFSTGSFIHLGCMCVLVNDRFRIFKKPPATEFLCLKGHLCQDFWNCDIPFFIFSLEIGIEKEQPGASWFNSKMFTYRLKIFLTHFEGCWDFNVF